jgi:hypothetical protein
MCRYIASLGLIDAFIFFMRTSINRNEVPGGLEVEEPPSYLKMPLKCGGCAVATI